MRFHLRAALAMIVLALLGVACQPHQFKATVLQPAKPISDFSMASSDGSTFTLSAHKDRFVVLYFGYTNCPDECPATLAQLKLMVDKLGAEANKVDVAFVTVDPQRDSLDGLKAYLSHFNPSFVGLRTDDTDQLTALGKEFGIYYELGTTTPQTSQYPVMHTSTVMVLNQMGLRAVFSSDTPGADMASDLHELMKSQ